MSLARFIGYALAAWLLAGTCLAASTKEKEKELKNLRGRIENVQKELESAEESRSEATDALKSSERAISQANRELRELAGQQEQTGNRLQILQSDSNRLRQDIAGQQELLSKQLHQRYLNGEDDALKLLLNQQDPNEAARQLHYFGHLSRARGATIQKLRDNLQKLQALEQETQEKDQELARIKQQQELQRQRLQSEHGERRKVLAGIARQIENRRHELATLKRDEQRLTQLIERLARIIEQKKRKSRSSGTIAKPIRQADITQARGAFSQLKGKLAAPVRGTLAHRFGSPREDTGAVWKGLFFKAVEGEAVRAVASGRVVFADWLRGFGNLLIVDHDDGFMSLYGNNETLYKQVGDAVKGGDTVAATGNSGGSPESGLYFELRYQSRPFDPLGWINAR